MVTSKVKPSSYISLQLTTKKDIMEFVGPFGSWQRRIFIIIFLVYMHVATHNMYLMFLAPNQEHWCASTPEAVNLSIEEWRRIGLPPNDQQCSRYETLNSSNLYQDSTNDTSIGETVPCQSWVYDTSFYTNTLVSQFDLVCKQKWLVSLSKSIFMMGILVSVVFFGHLADRFGRRPVIISASFITTIFATICAFSTSITMFMVIRFFVAVGLGGYYNTAFILFMEILAPEMRSTYGMGVQLGWCLGFLCLPAISWFIRDWFWIQIAVTIPSYFLIPILWRIPESPRWLLSRGKSEKARKILIDAAEVNGVQLTGTEILFEKAIYEARQSDEAGSCRTLLDLLKLPGMRKITLTLFFVWFVNSFIYFGLSFNTYELYGNPFVNFALSGAVEIPAYFLAIFIIKPMGRRKPLTVAMIAGAISCLLRYGLPRATSLWVLYVVISMVGKFCISCAFGILYVFTTELFPTAVRNIGLGSASMCEVLGTILAPYVRELGEVTAYPGLSHFIYGVFSALGGIFMLLLPETNNVTVPDTLEEFVQAISTKKDETSTLLEGKKSSHTKIQEMSTNAINSNNSTTRSVN